MLQEGGFRKVVVEGNFESRTELQMVPLESIRPRGHGSLRPLNELHVEELFDSIGTVGLLEPLVVDRCLRVLGWRTPPRGRPALEAPRPLAGTSPGPYAREIGGAMG
jgi:hypothetical protein